MKYYRGWVSTPIERFVPAVTEKSIAFTISGGYTTINDKYEFLEELSDE